MFHPDRSTHKTENEFPLDRHVFPENKKHWPIIKVNESAAADVDLDDRLPMSPEKEIRASAIGVSP